MRVCRILILKIPENLLKNSEQQFFKPSEPYLYVSGQLHINKVELQC